LNLVIKHNLSYRITAFANHLQQHLPDPQTTSDSFLISICSKTLFILISLEFQKTISSG